MSPTPRTAPVPGLSFATAAWNEARALGDALRMAPYEGGSPARIHPRSARRVRQYPSLVHSLSFAVPERIHSTAIDVPDGHLFHAISNAEFALRIIRATACQRVGYGTAAAKDVVDWGPKRIFDDIFSSGYGHAGRAVTALPPLYADMETESGTPATLLSPGIEAALLAVVDHLEEYRNQSRLFARMLAAGLFGPQTLLPLLIAVDVRRLRKPLDLNDSSPCFIMNEALSLEALRLVLPESLNAEEKALYDRLALDAV